MRGGGGGHPTNMDFRLPPAPSSTDSAQPTSKRIQISSDNVKQLQNQDRGFMYYLKFLILVDAGIRILDKWQGTMGQNGDYPQQLAFPDISGEQFINGYRLLVLLTSLPSFTLHQIDLILKIS